MEEESLTRFELLHTTGVISSSTCNILYDQENKRAVVGSLDEIKVWNLRTSVQEFSLQGDSQVSILARHPTQKEVLAVGYEDGSLRLWNLQDKQMLVQFNGHRSPVTALGFDTFNMRLASGGRDSDIVVWDLVGETGVCRLKGHTGGISSLKFMHSGQYLVSAARDSLVKIWDIQAEHCLETEVSHRSDVSSIEMSSDESILFTAGNDPVIRVFSVDHTILPGLLSSENKKSLSLLGEIPRSNPKERVLQVTLSSDHRVLGVLGAERTLELFQIRSKEEAKLKVKRKKKNEIEFNDLFKHIRTYRTTSKVHSFAFASGDVVKNVRVLFCFNNNRIEEVVIPVNNISEEVSVSHSIEHFGHRGEVKNVSISPDQQLVVTGGPDGCKVWSMSPSNELTFLRSLSEDIADVTTVNFLQDSKHILIGTKKGVLIHLDVETGSDPTAYQAHDGQIWSVQVGSDNRTIVSGGSDKTVKFWELKSNAKLKCVKTLQLTEEVLAVCLTRDLRLIAVSLLDLTIKVFFVDSLKVFLTLYGHKLPVTSLDISSDCKTLISGSADKSIKIWGLEFGEMKKSLLAHSEAVCRVAFLPDSLSFVSCGRDKQLKWWKTSNGAPLQRRFERSHSGEIWGMQVSASGSFIVSAGHDRSIKVWGRGDELLVQEEELEKEAEERLEESMLQEQGDSVGKQTVESLKAGERIFTALEDADLERQAADEAHAAGREHVPTPLFNAFKESTPAQYFLRQVESIPVPDLEQAILVLPSRLLPSLLYYLDQSISTPAHIASVTTCLNIVLRLFFAEISGDQQLRILLQSIRTKLRSELNSLDSLFMFNQIALQRAPNYSQ